MDMPVSAYFHRIARVWQVFPGEASKKKSETNNAARLKVLAAEESNEYSFGFV